MASLVNTYARAFADVVFSAKLDPAKTQDEAKSLAELVGTNRALREVWEAPSIPAAQKIAVLDAIAARGGFSRPLRNFAAVLIEHRRTAFLAAIVKQLEQELNQRLGFAEAEVVSARELDESERRALEAEVGKFTGKKVRARYSRDESLLGGAIVKVGSTIYDGSVKGKLERIKAAIRA